MNTVCPALERAVAHLNVPYGPRLTVADLRKSLQTGDAPSSGLVRDLLFAFFSETSSALQEQCVHESGASWEAAQVLYRQSIENGGFVSRTWERLSRAHLPLVSA